VESLHRRASGIYVARLTVPRRRQAVIGKRELIASTGSRELAVARIVAGELVAAWRRRLHNLDRLGAGLDVLQLTLGSPRLRNGDHIPLKLAAEQSGIDVETLLRMAREGRLSLFFRVSGLDGHALDSDDCERYVTAAGRQCGPTGCVTDSMVGYLPFTSNSYSSHVQILYYNMQGHPKA
jgi:hypothetical protein